MRNLLTLHGIPSDSINSAVEFLNSAPDATIQAFIKEFDLNLKGADALVAARFAADAIFRDAKAVDKVVGYVAKRMTGMAEKPATTPFRVVMVGGPVVDTSEVSVVPVVALGESDGRAEVAPAMVVKGRRGRKRRGDSAMCKAVKAIEASGAKEREALLQCIIAQGIKESSAVVYLWRYNKGERE